MQPLQSHETRRIAFTEAEKSSIREQLERMLSNPLFRHSKRYPTLLRYIVERTLEGSLIDLKERTLGVEVFGRDPNYDTNSDPVVRVTAGEIRKRIAQYYHEPGRENEIRIELLPGSYVPDFDFPIGRAEPVRLQPATILTPAAPRRRRGYLTVVASAAVLLAAVAWIRPWMPRSALDRFWAPVLDSSSTVLLCVGQRQFLGTSAENPDQYTGDLPRAAAPPDTPVTLFKLYYMGSQNVAFPDVLTLGRFAGLLHARGKKYHIRGESSTGFGELRDGPVVLVGALNNDWTMRLMGPMRFSFERDGDVYWIRDRRNPAKRNYAVNYSTPYLDLSEDYALISRVLDPTTDRMVVIAGGLTGYGTMAAGEFLTDANYLESLSKSAPGNWWRRNIQVVLATKVIHGNSGPPRVIDQYVW